MTVQTIATIVTLTAVLLGVFLWLSRRELRKGAERTPHAAAVPGPDAVPGPGWQPPPMRILVATDGSTEGERAVESVAHRTWPVGSEVEVVTVVHDRMKDSAAPEGLARGARSLGRNPDLRVKSQVLVGEPERAILTEAARLRADLIVVGAHPALGAVSEGLLRHAPCSVEVVR